MQGTILIPDITGFSNFVNSVNSDIGVIITRDLLNEIINSNPLKVELSEIEGDALLYYKVGIPITLKELFAGLRIITQAFDTKYRNLKKQYKIKVDLCLKFIVHYGKINLYEIMGSTKLYGETVIETHRLLKSGCTASTYILITKDYFSALDHISSKLQGDEEFLRGYEALQKADARMGAGRGEEGAL